MSNILTIFGLFMLVFVMVALAPSFYQEANESSANLSEIEGTYVKTVPTIFILGTLMLVFLIFVGTRW